MGAARHDGGVAGAWNAGAAATALADGAGGASSTVEGAAEAAMEGGACAAMAVVCVPAGEDDGDALTCELWLPMVNATRVKVAAIAATPSAAFRTRRRRVDARDSTGSPDASEVTVGESETKGSSARPSRADGEAAISPSVNGSRHRVSSSQIASSTSLFV